jgi:hypothetical protein
MDPESQELIEPSQERRDVLRWVPVFGLCVSLYSALFATFILYPWHRELSDEFHALREKVVCNS